MKSTKINLERTVIIPSKSRYELSLEKFGSYDEARNRFPSEEKWNEIVESDIRQKNNIKKIKKEFGTNIIIDRSGLTEDLMKEFDYYAFLGGDDHFTYCSQTILKHTKDNPGENKYSIGVVLDNIKSFGGLLYFNVDTFIDSYKKEFVVDEWTTLESKVDNGICKSTVYPAVSDIFIGEYCNLYMSRSDVFDDENQNKVLVDGKEILPEKTSGILIATGAGSGRGAWYYNVHYCYFDKSDEFPKNANFAKVIAREHPSRAKYTLKYGKTLEFVSYNDAKGIVAPDAHEDHSTTFDMGSVAKVKISDIKLKVIKPF